MYDGNDAPPALDAQDVREKVRILAETEGLSGNTVAKEAGVSASAYSQFMSGTYAGNQDKVAEKLRLWIGQRSEAERLGAFMPAAPDWVEAPTARKIHDALSYAQMAADIAVVYGGAGLSKTTTIRRYERTHPNVWVVTATPATASVAVLLEEIALALGLRDYALHPAKLQRAILSKVRDTGGLLVVDEAQHLTKQALEAARSIHDASEIGLALSGNASVYNRLYGGGENGFAQLFSRVGKRVALTRPMAGDVHAIAKKFGVNGKDERKALEEIARRPGALRMVVKTLRLAAVMSSGDSLALPQIRGAWEELQGGVPIEEATDAE